MLQSWLLAFRLKTLTASLVPVMVAVALASFLKFEISFYLVMCLLVSATAIQIATNLFNDAVDFEKGADQKRVGPVRVTQSGLIGVTTVYAVAIAFLLIALVFGFPLVLKGGWPLLLIGLSSLALAYGYTGGPFPLAYLGLGDLFVILYFGIVAVATSFFILTGVWNQESFLLGLQVGFLSTVLIALNNLRDRPEDQKVKKNTLAVKFGDSFVMWEIAFFVVCSYLFVLGWSFYFQKYMYLIYFVSLPLAFKLLKTVFHFKERSELIAALGMGAGLHVLFGLCFVVASLL
ncbi:1,4-dihydroxy-2-naphthoate octaprenyltransferase [bacterium]|nr:1,4-dihydroxy-2-naphthoate octaprenyltransferase [bacterium]